MVPHGRDQLAANGMDHVSTVGMERDTTVQRTMLVEASPIVIWEALTDPQSSKLFLGGQQARSTWTPGASVRWVETVERSETLRAKGIVMASIPGHRLRYTKLPTDGKLPDEPASYTTVDIFLQELSEGLTSVQLWQGDFAGLPQDVRRARAAGREWDEALVGLKRVSEELQAQKAA